MMVFWVTIKVYDTSHDLVDFLQWANLRYETRLKWDWYFKYRAALLQVKYPRAEVRIMSGSQPAQGKTRQQLVAQKIKAKKAKVTEYRRKMQLAVMNWNSLFPIEENASYLKALAKIERLEAEIMFLTNTLELTPTTNL